MTNEEVGEVPAFACCSAGIGRWFWVAWASESEAKALAPALASGYEKSATRSAEKAVEQLDTEVKRLPSKWASAYRSNGTKAAGSGRGVGDRERRPRSRFGRPNASPAREAEAPRLAFLYSAASREPPDALGHVTVARHRIVKQNPRKIHVERDPFDEEQWARRSGQDSSPQELIPRPRTVAVDRLELRKEGRFQCGRMHAGLTLYASEDAGIRDVEAALTAKYTWCATLGVRFPCSTDEIKAAYRRLALSSHPDRGGDAAEFREFERAYRAAVAYFTQANDERNRQ